MRLHRGFVFLDVLMGLMLVSMLGAILGAAAAMHQRSLKHLDATRAASRLAESALLSMQGGPSPHAAKEKSLSIHELSSAQVPGMNWVEVRATVHGQSASLVGLVPRNTIPTAGG